MPIQKEIEKLFEGNRKWAKENDPIAFEKMSQKHSPKYLWIGCSDSRVPANEILGLQPGEVFVHRNIANLFPHTDFNALSVLQFAIDYLKIERVIVCGHYGCAGVACAMKQAQYGLVDNWLRNIRDISSREKERLDGICNPTEKYKCLVELNVIYQVMNVCHTTIVQNHWAQNRKLSIYGWVYDISTGLLKDLNCCISSIDQIESSYRTLNLH